MEARKLQAKEISCRVQQITADGLSLLLYITSRAAMNLMDDTFGALMWKRESREVNGEERCVVSVYNPEIKEWISRDDVGTASYTEKEKGRASDAFKRACVNFGIGRSFIQHHGSGSRMRAQRLKRRKIKRSTIHTIVFL